MGFCSCTTKYFLFFFNFVIVVFSVALIVVGSIAYNKGKSLVNLLNGEVSAPAIAIIVIGVIIFIIAFLGCCGAIQESTCMMQTYAVLLLTLLVVEAVIGIVAFVYHSKVEGIFTEEYKNIFNGYNATSSNRDIVDSIQKTFQCCGLKDYKDYNVTQVPKSCCRMDNCNTNLTKNIWTDGCLNKVSDDLRKSLQIIGGVAIGFAIVEVFGVVSSLCLASHIRGGSRRTV